MRISQLNIYPVKGLRGISLQSARTCAQGLEFDRRYILLKAETDGTYSNMWLGEQPEMALCHCKPASSTSFDVSYRAPQTSTISLNDAQRTGLEIPFEPSTHGLIKTDIRLHKTSDYPAYIMPSEYNKWFSECFGYEVVLAYLGNGHGVPRFDENAQLWKSRVEKSLPGSQDAINFSDGGALLVTSEVSVRALDQKLPGDEKVVHEKFRPNISINGDLTPFEEDFWAEIQVKRADLKIILTSHCARCVCINVDLEQGKMGEGESGKLLKKMMSDRRIDTGHKWYPVFGRYGFPTSTGEIKVGDEVVVTERNAEYTKWNGYVPRLSHFKDSSA